MTGATALLAVSFGAGCSEEEQRRIERLAPQALQRVTGEETRRKSIPGGFLLLAGLGDGCRSNREWEPTCGSAVVLSRGPRTTSGQTLTEGEISRRLARMDLGDVAPPFAACSVSRQREFVAATDAVGLRHVYWVQHEGWAAVSTSGLALSSLTSSRLDEGAIASFALLGHYLGEATPFAGVAVLPPGAIVRLVDGGAEVYRSPPPSLPKKQLDRHRAVSEGVDVVRGLMAACLGAYPDPLLELSGGLDSRMLLAGIPPRERRGLRAATVGPSGTADHRIAAALSRQCGITHAVVQQDEMLTLEARTIADLAEVAALSRDCSGNPAALAVLTWQEGQLDQGPRLSGQNGEFARGFYYPGQRPHPRVREELVTNLTGWRLFTNEAADADIFAEGFLEDMRKATVGVLQRTFASYDTDWLSATDEFYLRERMRRWVGPTYSSACTRRVLQAPFFHPDYLRWARSCLPTDKRGSLVFVEVLSLLAPDLAAAPLDSGLPPRAMVSPSPLDRLKDVGTTLRKLSRKVDQRVRGRGRPARGAAFVADRVQEAWEHQTGALQSLSDLPWVDARIIDEVANGRRRLDPASVGLLLNLELACRVHRELQ